jgi:chromosome segregation ATPase
MTAKTTVMATKTRLLVALVLGLIISLPVTAKLYKWVDNDGVTHYGETIPPEFADKSRSELNKAGRVIKQETVLTPEERQAKKVADAKKREEENAALEKKRHDQTLMSTYSSGKEIDLARSRSVQQIDSHIKNINSQLNLINDTMLGLQKESEGYANAKKPAPPSLKEDLRETQARQDKLKQTLEKLNAEKSSIEARYDADKVRYHELTGK